MTGEPGKDYPEEKSPIDVRAQSRGDTLLSFVERVDNGELVISAGEDRQKRPVRLDAGEPLEVMWRGPDEMRTVPAELVAVETGELTTWRVRLVGPAARGQRRAAVRAPMDFRVTLKEGVQTLGGVTVDLSEGGMRCVLDDAPSAADTGTASLPAPGDAQTEADATPDTLLTVGSIHEVTVFFDGGEYVTAKGEVVRHFPREDQREEASIRFIGLPEKMGDLVRARVFARLRDMRARGIL